MMKAVWTGAVTAAALLLLSGQAFAQQTANVTVNVNVNARAKLDVGTTNIDFLDADPDVSSSLNAAPFSIDVKARTSSGGTVSLTVSAPNFSGPGGTIPIGNLSYAASGDPGFTATAPFSASAASAGTWTGSGHQAATHTYSLLNEWAYNVGTYSTTVTYTLTAP